MVNAHSPIDTRLYFGTTSKIESEDFRICICGVMISARQLRALQVINKILKSNLTEGKLRAAKSGKSWSCLKDNSSLLQLIFIVLTIISLARNTSSQAIRQVLTKPLVSVPCQTLL